MGGARIKGKFGKLRRVWVMSKKGKTKTGKEKGVREAK